MRNVIVLIVLIKLSATTAGWAQHWPHWRGPTHNGVSAETRLPDSWGAECAATPTPRGELDAGGPSATDPALAQRRAAPAGQNFEGRPIVATVCDNIVTKNVSWKLPLPAYSGSTPRGPTLRQVAAVHRARAPPPAMSEIASTSSYSLPLTAGHPADT